MKRVAPLALTAAAALAGCRVGPHYTRPTVPVAAVTAPTFIEQDARFAGIGPTDPRWWRLYRDPALDALIADAFAHNTDLRIAYANIARARGALREVRGQRFPTTDLSAGYSYAQSSTATTGFSRSTGSTGTGTGGKGTGMGGTGTGTGGTGTGTGGTGTGTGSTGASSFGSSGAFSNFNLGFAINYEIDLFGRVYRQIQAARRDLEAERALADQMRVTVAADTARSYVDLCASAEQEMVATRTVALLDRSLQITQLSLDYGRGTRLDVERARTLREQSAATVPPFQAARAAARYSLALLTGRAPADLRPETLGCRATPRLAAPFPIGDGRALLARRPDIRAAERTLAADTARIGVATADLYPTVTLGGSVGLSSGSARRLFSSDAFNYSIGPLLSFSFPNQEGARGRILQSQAQAAVSLATFDRTVLTALQETETALSALARELDRRQALIRARDSARVSAQLSRLRFGEGIDSFLTQLDADRTLAQAEAAVSQSDQAIAEDQTEVFRALGGGWEETGDNRGDVKPVFDGSRRNPAQPG